MMGSEAPKEKMDAAMEDLNQSLTLLKDYFLQNKPFIIGDKVSLADIVAVVEIMQVIHCPLYNCYYCSLYKDTVYVSELDKPEQ